MTYAADDLLEEAAYVAMFLHWELDAILDLEHADRRRFVEFIEAVNREE